LRMVATTKEPCGEALAGDWAVLEGPAITPSNASAANQASHCQME